MVTQRSAGLDIKIIVQVADMPRKRLILMFDLVAKLTSLKWKNVDMKLFFDKVSNFSVAYLYPAYAGYIFYLICTIT